ncbi:DUF6479 family protein [Streptomyces sp. NPDC058287]
MDGLVVVRILIGACIWGRRIRAREPRSPHPDQQPKLPQDGPVREIHEWQELDEMPHACHRLTPHEPQREEAGPWISDRNPRRAVAQQPAEKVRIPRLSGRGACQTLPYSHHMLTADAVDRLQADIIRCGGITIRLRAAALDRGTKWGLLSVTDSYAPPHKG